MIEAALRGTELPVVVAVAGRPAQSADSRIRYVGYVKDIEDCYRAADFTILASSYEPFGLVGIESVMCGTPVILSDNIGCCDAIAEHAKLLFPAGDVDGLRATLDRAVCAAHAPHGAAKPMVAKDGILYDTRVSSHVDALLALANEIDSRKRRDAAR